MIITAFGKSGIFNAKYTNWANVAKGFKKIALFAAFALRSRRKTMNTSSGVERVSKLLFSDTDYTEQTEIRGKNQ